MAPRRQLRQLHFDHPYLKVLSFQNVNFKTNRVLIPGLRPDLQQPVVQQQTPRVLNLSISCPYLNLYLIKSSFLLVSKNAEISQFIRAKVE